MEIRLRCNVNDFNPSLCVDGCHDYYACKARYDQTQRRIADNMEQFYNPSGWRKTQARRLKIRGALQKVFVGGIPYDNY